MRSESGMRRVLKILAYVVGGLAVLVAVGVVSLIWASNRRLNAKHVVTPRAVAIPSDAAAIARGRYLAETRGCNDCHGADYAGGKVLDDGAMGRLHGPNLTRGKGGRVAAFTDQDWVRAIRHGVGPDQRGLLIMPSEEYSHLSDEDLGALIAYLKSLPPIDRERVSTSLGPISRLLLATGKMKLPPEVIDHANAGPKAIPVGVTVEYGRYVAYGCIGCHGPNFSGGKIAIGPPDWPPAANLTPHPDGNIGKWTEQEFLQVMRTARRPDGTELSPVMPRLFAKMDDVELKALWVYFRSLPPVPTGER